MDKGTSSPFPDPETPEEWQVAVDAAQGVLAVELARLLGLIEGGAAKPQRCAEVIKRGAEIGITPSDDAVREFVGEIAQGADRERMYRVVTRAFAMSGSPDLAELVPFLAATEAGRES